MLSVYLRLNVGGGGSGGGDVGVVDDVAVVVVVVDGVSDIVVCLLSLCAPSWGVMAARVEGAGAAKQQAGRSKRYDTEVKFNE